MDQSKSAMSPRATCQTFGQRLPTDIWQTVIGPLKVTVGKILGWSQFSKACQWTSDYSVALSRILAMFYKNCENINKIRDEKRIKMEIIIIKEICIVFTWHPVFIFVYLLLIIKNVFWKNSLLLKISKLENISAFSWGNNTLRILFATTTPTNLTQKNIRTLF